MGCVLIVIRVCFKQKILPYETKPVMQASFLARVESNHTVYICIKTNHSEIVELVLPFEVEVTSGKQLNFFLACCHISSLK